MKKESVLERILFEFLEKKRSKLTQLELSRELGVSLSTVNNAITPLAKMGAVRTSPTGLVIVDAQKIVLYWSSARSVEKDVLFSTRVEQPIAQIEKSMPSGVFYAAYSGFKFRFSQVPADYSEVYVYAKDAEEVSRRFPARKGPPNLFVLRASDAVLACASDGVVSTARLYADLWNLPEWYAKEFLKALEVKMKW